MWGTNPDKSIHLSDPRRPQLHRERLVSTIPTFSLLCSSEVLMIVDVFCFLKSYWHFWVLRDLKVKILLVGPKLCDASIIIWFDQANVKYHANLKTTCADKIMAENQYSRSELEVEGAENAGVLCSLLVAFYYPCQEPWKLSTLPLSDLDINLAKCRSQNLDRNLADQMNPYPVPDKNCGESDDWSHEFHPLVRRTIRLVTSMLHAPELTLGFLDDQQLFNR